MSTTQAKAPHPFLDQKAASSAGAILLYTMVDGTHRFGARGEFDGMHAGSIGYPWGNTYRAILNDCIRLVEQGAKAWLEFYALYLQGDRVDGGSFFCRRGLKCTSFVTNGEAYTVYDGTNHTGELLGYGGARATVTLDDGRVIDSNNVWHHGTVPIYLRDVLAENATLTWAPPRDGC